VFLKGSVKENVKFEYKPRSFSLNVKLPNNQSEYVLDFEPLQNEIIPEECQLLVLSSKIEIKLKKKAVGIKWSALEGEETSVIEKVAVVSSTTDKPPTYPSSSKQNKDWNSIAKSVEDEKPEGEQALNALFQQIYKDGSDEVKKAMMKSFVESGGTTLSTNWDEVKKEQVPIRPPDGVEAKSWKQ
jgi:suppressor of G2 allele of SKP1